MPDLIAVRDATPWFRRLYLPAYQISDAARFSGISPQVVANWHYRRTAPLSSVLPGRERRRPLSYLELIEVAIVAAFRRLGVPLRNIRQTRQYMAQVFTFHYPFAEYRFKTDGFHLLMLLRDVIPSLNTEDLIVADASGQLAWNEVMEDRLLQFDYDLQYELALKWFVAGRVSKVVIDPRVAFGAPTVNGVPTWALKGRWIAGETIQDIEEDFGLTEPDVTDALKFEGIDVAV